jgi:phosphoserine phosphatase
MAGLIRLRASPRSLPSVPRLSFARTLPALQVAARFPNPLFHSANIRESRALLVAALDVSKNGSSAVLANSQPPKGSLIFLLEAF